MELVRARLRGGVDLRNRAAVLGVEEPGFDLEFLQRVHRRQQHVAVEVQIGVLDPVERVVVVVHPLPADVEREAVALAAHALPALARRRTVGGGAGREGRELQVVASVERQLDDRAVLDDRPDGRALGLQHRRAPGHFHDVGELADVQGDRDAVGAPDQHLDIGALDRAEPLPLGFQRVDAGLEGGDEIDARLIGGHLADAVGRDVGDGDLDARQHRSAHVGHDPADFA